MKSRRDLVGVLAALAALAVVAVGIAQPPPDVPRADSASQGPAGGSGQQPDLGFEKLLPPPPDHDLRRLSDFLDLTDTQKQAVQKLAQETKSAIKPLMEQLPPLYRQLNETMLQSNPDGERAKQLLRQVTGIRQDVGALGVDFWIATRAKLTPDQNTRLTQVLRMRNQEHRRRYSTPRQGNPAVEDPASREDEPPGPRTRREPDPGM